MEFWEKSFLEKGEMWGFEPAQSAVLANDIFVQHGVKHVLIPGIGYGRNAQLFCNNGMCVTGIEISGTAVEMARKHFGTGITIYQGSVTGMPFDTGMYEGIFCYALIHLLDREERLNLIRNCYRQLAENGVMIFTAVSKAAPTYGTGKHIGKDRYELFGGVNMFFYDRESVTEEFGAWGLSEIREVQENYPFYFIICRKMPPACTEVNN
jgi:SAM-dependent methyltransferase